MFSAADEDLVQALEELYQKLPIAAQAGIGAWETELDTAKIIMRAIGIGGVLVGEDEGTPFLTTADHLLRAYMTGITELVNVTAGPLAKVLYRVHREGEQQ